MIRLPARRRRSGRPAWKRWFAGIVALLLVLLAPVFAYAQGAAPDSVTLTWTAPGDDGPVGTATLYDMRYSSSPITVANWDAAPSVPGMPTPLVSGTRQTVTIRGLSRDTTYYVAIRSRDDASNWSPLSNVVRWDWALDTAPPSAPSGIAASRQTASVRVTWNANAEPDLAGYWVYRATAAAGPYAKTNVSLLTGTTQFTDSSLPPGATAVWYKVSAQDLNANESALSAAAQVSLGGGGTGVVADWTISPGYPNPSRAGESVCFPLVVPAGGAGEAAIDVVDSGGRRIRHLLVASAPTCVGGVAWDGRNDSGREVAPGVYRAWLVVGDRREPIKLVRQP